MFGAAATNTTEATDSNTIGRCEQKQEPTRSPACAPQTAGQRRLESCTLFVKAQNEQCFLNAFTRALLEDAAHAQSYE